MLAGEAYGSIARRAVREQRARLEQLGQEGAVGGARAHLRKLGANALAGVEHRAADNDACGTTNSARA